MFRNKTIAGAVAGLTLALCSGVASANVIDYTRASMGTTGSLFGGTVTWKMTASGPLNNSQAFDGNTKPVGSGLSFQSDGYGVGLMDDEITTSPKAQEWIKVVFSAPVLVDAIYFLDLFVAKDLSSLEVGQATIDGGSPVSIFATDIAGKKGPGFAAAIFAPIYASVIQFTVLSSNDQYGFADGALAGIGIAPVPVPAAGLLMLGGLGGLVAMRRRKKA
jgi:hypothetical protein